MDYKKVLITGAEGMVGKALQNILPTSKYNVISLPSSQQLDLRDRNNVQYCFNFYRPHYVIHLAAKVGGVKANTDALSDFYMDNIKMNTNVLEAAHLFKAEKIISLLSTCIYPDNANLPLTEEQIHNGPPHPSNYTYAYTKRMLEVQARSYNDQFNNNRFVSIIPNNLYGKNDVFHLEKAHVIPAIIRKIYEAKQKGDDITLWGDGKQLREFTYADDLAKLILMILEKYNKTESMNVGNTNEYSIKFIADVISKIMNYEGKIIWDETKPKGQFRKPSSTKRFKTFLLLEKINFNFISLEDGLKETCKWFEEMYPHIRGI